MAHGTMALLLLIGTLQLANAVSFSGQEVVELTPAGLSAHAGDDVTISGASCVTVTGPITLRSLIITQGGQGGVSTANCPRPSVTVTDVTVTGALHVASWNITGTALWLTAPAAKSDVLIQRCTVGREISIHDAVLRGASIAIDSTTVTNQLRFADLSMANARILVVASTLLNMVPGTNSGRVLFTRCPHANSVIEFRHTHVASEFGNARGSAMLFEESPGMGDDTLHRFSSTTFDTRRGGSGESVVQYDSASGRTGGTFEFVDSRMSHAGGAPRGVTQQAAWSGVRYTASNATFAHGVSMSGLSANISDVTIAGSLVLYEFVNHDSSATFPPAVSVVRTSVGGYLFLHTSSFAGASLLFQDVTATNMASSEDRGRWELNAVNFTDCNVSFVRCQVDHAVTKSRSHAFEVENVMGLRTHLFFMHFTVSQHHSGGSGETAVMFQSSAVFSDGTLTVQDTALTAAGNPRSWITEAEWPRMDVVVRNLNTKSSVSFSGTTFDGRRMSIGQHLHLHNFRPPPGSTKGMILRDSFVRYHLALTDSVFASTRFSVLNLTMDRYAPGTDSAQVFLRNVVMNSTKFELHNARLEVIITKTRAAMIAFTSVAAREGTSFDFQNISAVVDRGGSGEHAIIFPTSTTCSSVSLRFANVTLAATSNTYGVLVSNEWPNSTLFARGLHMDGYGRFSAGTVAFEDVHVGLSLHLRHPHAPTGAAGAAVVLRRVHIGTAFTLSDGVVNDSVVELSNITTGRTATSEDRGRMEFLNLDMYRTHFIMSNASVLHAITKSRSSAIRFEDSPCTACRFDVTNVMVDQSHSGGSGEFAWFHSARSPVVNSTVSLINVTTQSEKTPQGLYFQGIWTGTEVTMTNVRVQTNIWVSAQTVAARGCSVGSTFHVNDLHPPWGRRHDGLTVEDSVLGGRLILSGAFMDGNRIQLRRLHFPLLTINENRARVQLDDVLLRNTDVSLREVDMAVSLNENGAAAWMLGASSLNHSTVTFDAVAIYGPSRGSQYGIYFRADAILHETSVNFADFSVQVPNARPVAMFGPVSFGSTTAVNCSGQGSYHVTFGRRLNVSGLSTSSGSTVFAGTPGTPSTLVHIERVSLLTGSFSLRQTTMVPPERCEPHGIFVHHVRATGIHLSANRRGFYLEDVVASNVPVSLSDVHVAVNGIASKVAAFALLSTELSNASLRLRRIHLHMSPSMGSAEGAMLVDATSAFRNVSWRIQDSSMTTGGGGYSLRATDNVMEEVDFEAFNTTFGAWFSIVAQNFHAARSRWGSGFGVRGVHCHPSRAASVRARLVAFALVDSSIADRMYLQDTVVTNCTVAIVDTTIAYTRSSDHSGRVHVAAFHAELSVVAIANSTIAGRTDVPNGYVLRFIDFTMDRSNLTLFNVSVQDTYNHGGNEGIWRAQGALSRSRVSIIASTLTTVQPFGAGLRWAELVFDNATRLNAHGSTLEAVTTFRGGAASFDRCTVAHVSLSGMSSTQLHALPPVVSLTRSVVERRFDILESKMEHTNHGGGNSSDLPRVITVEDTVFASATEYSAGHYEARLRIAGCTLVGVSVSIVRSRVVHFSKNNAARAIFVGPHGSTPFYLVRSHMLIADSDVSVDSSSGNHDGCIDFGVHNASGGKLALHNVTLGVVSQLAGFGIAMTTPADFTGFAFVAENITITATSWVAAHVLRLVNVTAKAFRASGPGGTAHGLAAPLVVANSTFRGSRLHLVDYAIGSDQHAVVANTTVFGTTSSPIVLGLFVAPGAVVLVSHLAAYSDYRRDKSAVIQVTLNGASASAPQTTTPISLRLHRVLVRATGDRGSLSAGIMMVGSAFQSSTVLVDIGWCTLEVPNAVYALSAPGTTQTTALCIESTRAEGSLVFGPVANTEVGGSTVVNNGALTVGGSAIALQSARVASCGQSTSAVWAADPETDSALRHLTLPPWSSVDLASPFEADALDRPTRVESDFHPQPCPLRTLSPTYSRTVTGTGSGASSSASATHSQQLGASTGAQSDTLMPRKSRTEVLVATTSTTTSMPAAQLTAPLVEEVVASASTSATMAVESDEALRAAKEADALQVARVSSNVRATGAAVSVAASVGVNALSLGGVGAGTVARGARIASLGQLARCLDGQSSASVLASIDPSYAELPLQFPLPLGASAERALDGLANANGAVLLATLLAVLSAATPGLLMTRGVRLSGSPIGQSLLAVSATIFPAYFAPNVFAVSSVVAMNAAHLSIIALHVCCLAGSAAATLPLLWAGARSPLWAATAPGSDDDDKKAKFKGRLVDTTPAPFARWFGVVVNGAKNYPGTLASRLHVGVEVVVAMLLGLIAAAPVASRAACVARALVAAILAAAYLVYLVVVRPYRSKIEMGFVAAAGVAQQASAIAVVIFVAVPSAGIAETVAALGASQAALLMAQPAAVLGWLAVRRVRGPKPQTGEICAPLLAVPLVGTGAPRLPQSEEASLRSGPRTPNASGPPSESRSATPSERDGAAPSNPLSR